MKIRKSVKLGIKLFIVIPFAVYLIAIIICTVKMNSVVKVEYYSSSGFDNRINYTQIDMTNKSMNQLQKYYNGKVIYEHKTVISNKKLREFKAVCIFCCFPIWRKEYFNNHILDGSSWETDITYKDGIKKKTDGYMSYPLTYKFIMHEIGSIK